MSRADAIERAFLAKVRRRQTIIDGSPALVSVSITVRLLDGAVRAVVYSDEQAGAERR